MGKLNNDISKIDIFENALILINTTGATSGAGTAFPLGAPESTLGC
jgi:hypothetical protein